jgi:hypothetical protein
VGADDLLPDLQCRADALEVVGMMVAEGIVGHEPLDPGMPLAAE